MLTVRPAAVAGTFYPGDPSALSRAVDGMLAAAAPDASAPVTFKALIVPHAGYVYSGPIAAAAYARLRKACTGIRRVVLLGPAHRVAVRGLALPGVDAFVTPLGQVAIDAEGVATARRLPQVADDPRAHAQEHALEVQLPFLQRVLGAFTLVPLVVGAASAASVAEVLEALWGGPETLVVVSSDLSHYLPYGDARRIDRATADAILDRAPHLDHDEACGATPINGLLVVARKRALVPELFDLRNSGDTAGDRRQVVGYASFGLREEAADVRH